MRRLPKVKHALFVLTTYIIACVMVFSLVPTWALATDQTVDDVSVLADDQELDYNVLDDSANVIDEPSADQDTDDGEVDESPVGFEQEEDAGAQVTEEEPALPANPGDTEEPQTVDEEPAPSAEPATSETETVDANTDEGQLDETEPQEAEPSDKPAIEVESTTAEEPAQESPHVLYRTRVKGSWQDYVKDGEVAGSASASLQVEAVRIKLDLTNTGHSGGIEYRVKGESYGWQGWTSNDGLAGKEQSKRVEAIAVRLTGALAQKFDVYYSVRCQTYGWMAWAKNGETAGSAGQSKRIEGIKVVLVPKGEATPSSGFVQCQKAFEGGSTLTVQAYMQKKGWLKKVGMGKTAGTTKKSLRLEVLKVSAPGLDVPGDVMLSGYVQGKGWTGYKSGKTGTKKKRLEAVRIKLTGEAASAYDVYYRTYVAHLGWLNWAKNGENAGTRGMSCRMGAVQVVLVRKGAAAPSSSGSSQSEAYLTGTKIGYRAHCQSYGWRSESWNGKAAGTTGKKVKRLDALKVRLSGGTIGGGVKYTTYVTGSGWQTWASDNGVSGSSKYKKNIEGVRIKLTGRAAKMYDVYYQTYFAKKGWIGWAKNGQQAGAPGSGVRMEAVRIKLVPKGGSAPGSTANHKVKKSFFTDAMLRKAQGYSSSTGWLILVDDAHTKLAVFRGSKGNWKKYDSWTVSTGKPSTPSKHGVFSVGDRGYSFGEGYTCYYWVSWSGPYLFHSIKYYPNTFKVEDGRLGRHISMGCVRMPIGKAKWIYDHIPTGTTVVVY